jgi:hypothetical protein
MGVFCAFQTSGFAASLTHTKTAKNFKAQKRPPGGSIGLFNNQAGVRRP